MRFALALLVVIWAASAKAGPVNNAEYQHFCGGYHDGFGEFNFYERFVDGITGSSISFGCYATFFGKPKLSVSVSMAAGDRPIYGGDWQAKIDFDVQLTKTGTLPREISDVPLKIEITGLIYSTAGFARAFAEYAAVRRNGSYTAFRDLAQERTVDNTRKIIQATESIGGAPNGILHFTKFAVCAIYLLRDQSGNCEATIDPGISLDQATFDARNASLRLQTFTLSDYFRLEYNPNIAAMMAAGQPAVGVPAPSTTIAFGFALAVLAFWATWQRGTGHLPN